MTYPKAITITLIGTIPIMLAVSFFIAVNGYANSHYPVSNTGVQTKPAEIAKGSSPAPTETVHYVTLKFTQSSFSLSIRQHMKDKANAFSFTFPTTKKFYDSVEVGQEISSKFKTASLLLSGNIGSRKVVVEKKFTKQEPVYTK